MPTETPNRARWRRYPRFSPPNGMTAAWNGGGDQQVSSVGTISLGGMFLSVSHTRVVGTPLKLVSVIPEGIFQAEAIVRNIRPGQGMGVEFTKMESTDRALLERLLTQLPH